MVRIKATALFMKPNQASPSHGEIRAALFAHPGALFSIFVFSCLVNILMLTGPIFMMQVYDRVLSSGSVPTLVALLVIVTILYVYYAFLESIRQRAFFRLGRNFEETLRARVFDATAELSLNRRNNVGGQPIQDLVQIRQFLSGSGPIAYLDMPWVPIYLIFVSFLHPYLGLLGVFACVLIFIVALLTDRATRRPVQESTVAQARASMMTDEARRSTEAMHALGMRGALRRRWEVLQQEALDQQTMASDATSRFGSMSRVVRLLIQSGMLALGAYLVLKGELSGGSIFAASTLISRGMAPVDQAVGNWPQFIGFRKAVERLQRILDAVPPEVQRMQLPPPKGLLDVENLTVVLPDQQKPILNGLAFRVLPGHGLGVIGPTGAGKSTLARVLVGLIAPSAGAIRLDGATPDQRSADERGRVVGYLPQEVQLFDGTVAQNISRFYENPSPDDIVAAAQMANVHDMIMRLPKGYDTQLGENGARLSAGQRQRVALARALFGNPALLVMDEPNSNLDAEGEAALDRAMRASMARGAAVVVVAHRPSALNAVHDILVLGEGRTLALGKRDEVLKQVTRGQQPPPQKLQTIMPQPPVPQTRN
jgi:PrtD family type I secretion system ABC transporter